MSITRPQLRQVPLSEVPLPPYHWPQNKDDGEPKITITISIGQTLSVFHQVGYDQGAYLLELDAEERPIRAYHRGKPS